MVIAASNGNEPWIFNVWEPEDLVGAHRECMASALAAGEPLRYLLYSPAWQGKGRHFGITSSPASHALAVTDRHFVITRDAHDGSSATATSIPFTDLISIEKGSALLLAWFVAHFVERDQLRTLTILHKSTGSHHFDEAIRCWRRALPAMKRSLSLAPDEHWRSVPRFLYFEIEPLLLEGERLHASLHAMERWVERRRFFRVDRTFVQPWASALLADRTLILGTAERPADPTLQTFGANVTIAPYGAIASMAVCERQVRDVIAQELRVELVRGRCTTSMIVPFDGDRDTGEAVEAIVRAR